MPWHGTTRIRESHFIFRCSNRLDRDTSGLTVISKHLVSASIMADMTKKTPGTQGIPGNRKG